MGGKKKKYNARFPPARIKKIMQTDEEVGKIAAPVPVVISRALELFLESVITESVNKANESNAKTLTSSHIKFVIQSNAAFDFLKSQVALVPDLNTDGECSTSTLDKLTSAKNDDPMTSSEIAQPTKRSRAAANSSTEQSADSKPKRKRGRPPKVKPECEDEQMNITTTETRVTHNHMNITNGVKEEAMEHMSHTQTNTIPSPADSQQHPVISQHVMSHSRPESIFSTDTTFLSAQSAGYRSPAAHTGSRQYPSLGPKSLQLQHHGQHVNSSDILSAYSNLSPTSQPIDLSTKASVVGAMYHSNTTTDTLPGVSHPMPGLVKHEKHVLQENPYTSSAAVLDDEDDYDNV